MWSSYNTPLIVTCLSVFFYISGNIKNTSYNRNCYALIIIVGHFGNIKSLAEAILWKGLWCKPVGFPLHTTK